jgi:hypothetical protein
MKNLKLNFIFWSILITQILSNCDRKSELNQITVKLNSIDEVTKKPRVNKFDTIEVRVESFGFPKKRFKKIAEYTTNSSGSVKIKIDPTEKYLLFLGAPFIYGSEYIIGEKFINGQELNIEAIDLRSR